MKSSLTYYTSLVFLICCMALIITSVDIFKAYVPLKGITILIPMLALVVMCFKVLASKRSFVFLLFSPSFFFLPLLLYFIYHLYHFCS